MADADARTALALNAGTGEGDAKADAMADTDDAAVATELCIIRSESIDDTACSAAATELSRGSSREGAVACASTQAARVDAGNALAAAEDRDMFSPAAAVTGAEESRAAAASRPGLLASLSTNLSMDNGGLSDLRVAGSATLPPCVSASGADTAEVDGSSVP